MKIYIKDKYWSKKLKSYNKKRCNFIIRDNHIISYLFLISPYASKNDRLIYSKIKINKN